MNVAQYSLLLINPTVDRLDTVVVGAVFNRQGGWDVRVASGVQKMKAIDPTFPESRLSQTASLVSHIARDCRSLADLRCRFDGARLGVLLDGFVGRFTYADESTYQHEVSAVLAESVNPPTLASANAAPVSRRRNVVRRKLRDQFKARGLWSRRDEDIEAHRVVEQFTISPSHGLVADFALKNSVMHITETVDFEVQSFNGKRLQAQAKALVLNEAVRVFGPQTKRYVVAAGSSNPDVKQSVLLLQDHADVFALESADDMKAYIDRIALAASGQSPLI
ncbi:hypothetical protein ACS5PK_22250 [Roseateles sp. DB2]|uniref:hypothetical protein n=1 Tax=Roseateles sp. DB2 TaxID=3453717 RepID=UPI003EEF50CF